MNESWINYDIERMVTVLLDPDNFKGCTIEQAACSFIWNPCCLNELGLKKYKQQLINSNHKDKEIKTYIFSDEMEKLFLKFLPISYISMLSNMEINIAKLSTILRFKKEGFLSSDVYGHSLLPQDYFLPTVYLNNNNFKKYSREIYINLNKISPINSNPFLSIYIIFDDYICLDLNRYLIKKVISI